MGWHKLSNTLTLLLLIAACNKRDAVTLAGPKAIAAPQPATAVAVAGAVQAPAPEQLEGYRTAYDLIENRVHVLRHHAGRLVIEAGQPEFLKFVDGGWKTWWILAKKDGEKSAAFVSQRQGVFFIPVDSDGDGLGGPDQAGLTLRLTMRAVAPKQRVSVFVNEKMLTSLDVAQTWETYTVTVPAIALRPGENQFRLNFRASAPIAGGKTSAAAVARIAIGPLTDTDTDTDTGAGPAPSAEPLHGQVSLQGELRNAFTALNPGRLSFYVQVPENARLSLGYGSAHPRGTALVRVARDGAPAATLFQGPAASNWTDQSWDLGPFANQAVRIDLVSRGGGVAWATPRIVVKDASPRLPAPSRRTFNHIFVWMVDTLRADKLLSYNPKSVVETPNYDAFAKDATRFAWAHVPGTWSLPSHASILTGVYPTVHGAVAHEARLSGNVSFIAEVLKKAGYRTGLFSSNGYVSDKWGFGRGWDINRNFIRESLPNKAPYLWTTAKKWIFADTAKPLFTYLATIEPHVAYNPDKKYLTKYWDKPYRGPLDPPRTGLQLGAIASGKLRIDDTDKAYLEALYNAEITESDAAFGVFLADLRAAGLYDSSAIVIISDHGDEFWDHGRVGHAQSVHQELVHVPLIIRAPGLLPEGHVVQADVEAMDLFPTLLELAGAPLPTGVQGSSLIPLVHDELRHSPRVALSQNGSVTRGIKVARYRFIHAGAERLELYDELNDPREQTNLAADRPIAMRHMRNVFGLLVSLESQWNKRVWGTSANVTEAFYAR
jgi:arylsulfatase A-like enzyme